MRASADTNCVEQDGFYTNESLNGARMYQTHFCYLEGEETGS